MSQSLIYQVADLEQQAKDMEIEVKQTVDSVLRADDKLLTSLQKLAADLEPEKTDNFDTIARIRELCARYCPALFFSRMNCTNEFLG